MANLYFKHDWVQGKDVGMGPKSLLHNTWLCRDCGMVRNRLNPNGDCKGKIRVETRNVKS